MNAQEIQAKIDKLHYWDARVLSLNCDYFADEVFLLYEDSGGNVSYTFTGCYNVKLEHNHNYDKRIPSKQLKYSQIPYFLQDVAVSEVESNGTIFYYCKINMVPLFIEILCKEIHVDRVN